MIKRLTHPEINIKVTTTTEFTVADLERDGHLVVRVKRLVEAFACVCLHLDIMGGADGCKAQKGREERAEHDVGCRVVRAQLQE